MILSPGAEFVLTDQWFYNPGGKCKTPVRRGNSGVFGTITEVTDTEINAELDNGDKIFFFNGKTDKGAFTSKFKNITLPIGLWCELDSNTKPIAMLEE